MKYTSSASRSPRHTEPAARHGESEGQGGVSIAPPEYGIDFVDRDLADFANYEGNAGLYQTKLTVGRPGDEYEQEADQVAKEVVGLTTSASGPTIEGMALDEEELRTKPLVHHQASVEGGSLDAGVERAIQKARGQGQPLPENMRASMEGAFGANFSGVRVHTGSEADVLNRSLSARAFTTGRDIFFRQGEYNPGSAAGKEVMAHELTHVVQQSDRAGGGVSASNISRTLLVQRLTLRESMSGQWTSGLVELVNKYSGAGGVIDRQKDAVRNFVGFAAQEDPPTMSEQIFIGAINMMLSAALGGIGTVLKSAISSGMRPALVAATRVTMGTAVDSAQVRSSMRSTANAIVDKMTEAGKTKIGSAVSSAWSGAATEQTQLLRFQETQLNALNEIAQEQVTVMNVELARLAASEGEEDEWEAANALYEAFQSTLSSVYNEQFNKMTDIWFTMQVGTIGLGTRPGVLQIELNSRYPDQGSFSISGGNLLGAGSVADIRNRLAQRPLKDITIPKVIRMNGSMGYGVLDCMWSIHVTGTEPPSSGPSISAPRSSLESLTAGPQRMSSYSGNRWGLPWLAAFHLGLNDLDGDDERYNSSNVSAGAREVWDAIKDMRPGSIGSSTW